MPRTLSRLPCGIIYTEAFHAWLSKVQAREADAHPHRMLTLDYIRCASGPRRGRAWWRVHWTPMDAAAPHSVFRMGDLKVHIPKAVQLGLRDRCLDVENERVVVNP